MFSQYTSSRTVPTLGHFFGINDLYLHDINIDQTICDIITVADPGFPVRGVGPLVGAWTPDAGGFWQNCMQNERIGSHRRPCTQQALRSANALSVTIPLFI